MQAKKALKNLPSHEPVMLLSTITVALSALVDAMTDMDVQTWQQAFVVIMSLAVRHMVDSPATAKRKREESGS